jgi:hypothetical protein
MFRLIFFDPPGQQGGSIAARAFDHGALGPYIRLCYFRDDSFY